LLITSESIHKIKTELLQSQSPQEGAQRREAPIDANNCFIKKGENWEISYEGELGIFKNRKGWQYIAQLLMKPNQDIDVVNLDILINPRPALDNPNAELFDTDSTSIGPLDSGANQTSQKTIQNYVSRLREIKEEIAESKELGEHERSDSLLEEQQWILETINHEKRISSNTSNEKSWKRVSNAINDAINKLDRSRYPLLVEHLKSSIKTGNFCSYKPQKKTEWVVVL
jgi:hypothetical protein